MFQLLTEKYRPKTVNDMVFINDEYEMKDALGYFYDPRVYSIDYMSTLEEDEKPAKKSAKNR